MRTRFQNLRSSTALVRPAPSSGLPGQFYVNMVDRIIGFFNDAGQPVDFAYLPLAGGSLSGFLTLHANPTADLHAATKGYSDTQDTALNAALRAYTDAQVATRLPLLGGQMNGQIKSVGFPVAPEDLGSKGYIDAQVATRLTQAQADARFLQLSGGTLTNFLTLHANPTAALHAATKGYTDTQVATRLTQAQADARFLQLSGGTLTGALTLPGPPTQPLHAATKEFVETLIAEGGAATHVGDTPPAGPEQGQLWFRTLDPVGLFVWYVDVDSGQWVSVGGGGSGGSEGYDAPLGAVSYFAGSTAPNGWLVCNGQPVTPSFPDLRAFLLSQGAPFGTSGADPRVPDLRGEFIRGWDNGRGVDAGRVFGSAQLDQIQRLVGQLSQVQTIGTGLLTSGILRQLASTSSAIWQGSTAVNRNTTLQLDTDFDPSIRDGAETRGRNVALLPCIKAFDSVDDAGSATLIIATPAEALAGLSNTVLMTPANTKAVTDALPLPLGVNQVWKTIPPASRPINTAHQNTAGRPVMLCIRARTASAGNATVEVSADATTWVVLAGLPTSSVAIIMPVTFVLSVGHYWRINGVALDANYGVSELS